MWDVFICHASEDKDAVARPLAHALAKEGLQVWYDEFSLSLGDSLRQAIDNGLAGSRYGVVILSPHFLEKRWPQRELDGLTTKEMSLGKTILPVWHNITKEEVERFSPSIADKVAVTSSSGLDVIVRTVVEAIRVDSPRRSSSSNVVSAATEAAPLERPARSAFALGDFQKLVDYAYSGTGLNLSTKQEAGEWAFGKMKDDIT